MTPSYTCDFQFSKCYLGINMSISISGINDLFQQNAILMNQLVQQLAETDRTRTMVSVGTAVYAAQQGGSNAALLQEIYSKNFPGEPLPTVVDSATFAEMQKAQAAKQP